MEIVIHTVAEATWTKYAKWRVELELVGHPKRVCWLSDAQYQFLMSAFKHTKNGYSDAKATITGIFDDEKGYYQRCKAVKTPRKATHVTPLVQEVGVAEALRDTD